MGWCEAGWVRQNVNDFVIVLCVFLQLDTTDSVVQRSGKQILSVSHQVYSPGVPLI